MQQAGPPEWTEYVAGPPDRTKHQADPLNVPNRPAGVYCVPDRPAGVASTERFEWTKCLAGFPDLIEPRPL